MFLDVSTFLSNEVALVNLQDFFSKTLKNDWSQEIFVCFSVAICLHTTSPLVMGLTTQLDWKNVK